MKTTSISFRMDEELKKQTEETLDAIGLNMSSAITIFAKAVVRTGSIPFDLMVDPFYRKEHQDELTRRIERYETDETQMIDMTEEFEDA